MLFVKKENPRVFYFEEKMFTKEIKDGRALKAWYVIFIRFNMFQTYLNIILFF